MTLKQLHYYLEKTNTILWSIINWFGIGSLFLATLQFIAIHAGFVPENTTTIVNRDSLAVYASVFYMMNVIRLAIIGVRSGKSI